MITRRVFALAAALGPVAALAAETPTKWPSRPVKILIGAPPGSDPDLVARIVAEGLWSEFGQPVIVDNKRGAGGNIMMDQVARSTDEHTFGLALNGNLTTAKKLNSRLPYDPSKDFVPVGLVAKSPFVLVTQSGKPSGKRFFEQGVAAGNKWSYGSLGLGTFSHLWMELMQKEVGLRAEHIPFAGAQQVILALLNGEVDMALLPPSQSVEHIKSGKLKPIVVSGGRSRNLPDVPPMSEYGFNVFPADGWLAMVGPASATSPQVVSRFDAALRKVLSQEAVRQRIAQQGWEASSSSPEEVSKLAALETARFDPVIERLGLKLD